MKKLNKKEMAKVSGGSTWESSMSREEIDNHKGSPVDKYDGIEGNTYVFKDSNDTIIGKLVRTYERDDAYGSTKRAHEVQIIDILVCSGKGYSSDRNVILDGDSYQMYEYID